MLNGARMAKIQPQLKVISDRMKEAAGERRMDLYKSLNDERKVRQTERKRMCASSFRRSVSLHHVTLCAVVGADEGEQLQHGEVPDSHHSTDAHLHFGGCNPPSVCHRGKELCERVPPTPLCSN